MQMLAVVSGADIIQDAGEWFKKKDIEYNNEHRDPEKKDLVPRPVDISNDPILYGILGTEKPEGAPSWHHQLVGDIRGTSLSVSAKTITQGEEIIEGLERRDRSFCIGVQFHPEVAVRKSIDKEANAAEFTDYEHSITLFYALEAVGEDNRRSKTARAA